MINETRHRWTDKPPRGTQVDRSEPLARGLRGCWPINEGAGLTIYDVVGGNHLTMTANIRATLPGVGACIRADSTNYAVCTTARGLFDCSHAFTLLFWRYRSNGGDAHHFFTIGTGTGGVNFSFPYFSDGSLHWYRASDGADLLAGPSRWDDFTAEQNVLTYDGTNAAIYLKGVRLASGAVTTPDTGPITRVALFVNSNASFPEPMVASAAIGLACLYDRALSASEVAALAADRYRIFLPPTTRRFLVPAAGAAPSVATKTWSFATDAMGMTAIAGSASINFGWVSADQAIQFTSATKNLASQFRAVSRSTTGETWETWGVPPGSTVRAIQVTGWSKRLAANTGLTAAQITIDVIDSGGLLVYGAAGNAIAATLPTTPTATTYSAGAAGASLAVNAEFQASTTDVRLQLKYTESTGNTNNPSVDYRFDEITLQMTYSGGGGTPAAMSPASMLMGM